MSSITGDFDMLKRCMRYFRYLGNARLRAAEAAAPELAAIAHAEWESGTNANGTAWRPNVDGGVSILPVTRAITVGSTLGSSIVITSDRTTKAGIPLTALHNKKRPVWPKRGPLPASWRRPIEEALTKEFEEVDFE